MAKIKRNKSCAPCMVGNVRAAKAVIFSKLNQRRRLAQRRRILATTIQKKKVGSQLEIKATKKVGEVKGLVVGAFGEGSEDLHTLIHHLATSRVRVAGPQRGKRGQVRTEEAELAITTSFLRRTISVAGVRAQAKLLLSRLEVIGPVTGVAAAAGRRSLALNLERIVANQRRADLLSRLQGKALLRRGHFRTD